MEEKEIVVFADEDGNDIEMEVLAYLEYNEKEYAVLTEVTEEEVEEAEVMFAEVVPVEGSEEEVELIPVEDDELADNLFESLMSEEEE